MQKVARKSHNSSNLNSETEGPLHGQRELGAAPAEEDEWQRTGTSFFLFLASFLLFSLLYFALTPRHSPLNSHRCSAPRCSITTRLSIAERAYLGQGARIWGSGRASERTWGRKIRRRSTTQRSSRGCPRTCPTSAARAPRAGLRSGASSSTILASPSRSGPCFSSVAPLRLVCLFVNCALHQLCPFGCSPSLRFCVHPGASNRRPP